MPLAAFLFNVVLVISVSAISQEKETKGINIAKAEVQFSIFTDDIIVNIKNPKDSIKNVLEPIL